MTVVRTLALAATALAVASPAFADTVQTINTDSLSYGTFGTSSGNIGPWPFSNFGIQASTSIAMDMSVGVQGATQFSFPSISVGDVFHASTSQLDYGYSANWTNASIGSHSGLSASASFNYDIGPFSGSKSIYDQSLNTTSNGNLGTGATLTGGSANSEAVGDKYGASYGLSAYVASASVGVNVGLNLQNSISYTPTVQYGYYSWINTTGGLTGADHLTFTSVSSGGNLDYLFPSNIASTVGSENFHLNFMPAVRMALTINGSSTITVPLDGTFSAEAFGATLASIDLPLGNLYKNKVIDSTWEDDVEWNNGQYYSLNLHQDNLDCQLHPSDSCATYTVEAEPTFVSQTLLPQNNTHDHVGTSIGGFDPGLSNAPKLPSICNPAGECWRSDDPNAPLGPGSQTFTVSSVPEPTSWATMVAGLALLGASLRSRRMGADSRDRGLSRRS